MKKIVQITAFILIYFLFCAKSCDNQEQSDTAREQNRIKSAKDSLISVFGSDTLSVTALNAFEETAKLRFNDFMDYLVVLSDTGTASEFRTHARQMIRDLFRSENSILRFSIHQEGIPLKEITVKELTGEESSFVQNISGIKLDSLWIMQDLHPVSDSVFSGRLGFSTRDIHAKADLNRYHLAGSSIEFFAIMRGKKFGKETLKVWTVLLGENNY